MAFRFLDTAPAPGAWNMAVDQALLAGVREGAPPVLRFYRWRPYCLSLGRNQPARGHYHLERIRAHGYDVVRRPTGGRAVLHAEELTYSVVLPERLLGGPREAYATVNRALAAGLRRLGVPVMLQPRGVARAPVPSLAPCFREPAEGEVVAMGRKLVGSAQVRERGALLQHGSLLLAGDQSAVQELLRTPPPPGLDVQPAVLADFVRPLPAWEALTAALRAGWAEVLGAEPRADELSAAEAGQADALAERFADLAWTWRF